ncbi:MAG: histidine phosphatase family protein [Anaerolineaceae bacterium]|nr:histidine phosphatase family protein [Anaerolineaceae bacterium]
MIRLIVVRHGRTALNTGEGMDERFRGTIDAPLAPDGLEQARATGRRLAGRPLTAVYSSPLLRARSTAEAIAGPHGLPVRVLPGLSSMSFGQWAGLSHADVARRWPDVYAAWRRDPLGVPIPGGESVADLRDRALATVRDVTARHAPGETLLVVTHQAVTRLLACGLVDMPTTAYWQVRQDLCNLSTYLYDVDSRRFSVETLNDTCHLDPELPLHRGPGVRIILVRHGQTAWNPGAGPERFRGRTDLPLDATGEAQAERVARRLAPASIAAIYASPLQRARQTVAPLAARLGLPVQSHQGLTDINYGLWQGLTHAEAATAYPELHRLWRTRPDQVRFPDGESLADVRDRLRTLLGQLAEVHPGQTVVLVGHQIVNKVLACTLLDLELDQIGRIGQEPAAFNVFVRQSDRWDVLRLNDCCHLAGL